MTNMISQLWYGNIDPAGELKGGDPEMEMLQMLRERNLEKLRPELGEGALALLEKYTGYMDEYAMAAESRAFCLGYCLGSRLTAEALIGSERLL